MSKQAPSKLFKLKQWLTLPEAVRHLTGICGEEVTEADIFRLALDGHLTLSINIVNNTPARLGQLFYENIIDGSQNTNNKIPTNEKWDLISCDPNGISYIKLDDDNMGFPINGIWDLPLMFDDRLIIQRKYHDLIDAAPISRDGTGIVVLKGNDKLVCQLQEFRKVSDNHVENFFPSEDLPEDSFFIVTIESLKRFEQALLDSEDDCNSEKHAVKFNGHKERHAQNREQILGAALAVLAKWPDECRDSKGDPVASKIADLVEAKAHLFWLDGQPPLKTDSIADHLREWIRKANNRK